MQTPEKVYSGGVNVNTNKRSTPSKFMRNDAMNTSEDILKLYGNLVSEIEKFKVETNQSP